MNKKGLFNIVVDILIIFLVLVAILGVVYFGFWNKTQDIVKSKLPATEKLKALIERYITSPGEAEIQKQEAQAEEIAIAIKRTMNSMTDTDCIEQIDYSKVTDKDFNLEFREENGKSTLNIYKIINNQQSYNFDFPYIPVYYFTITGTSLSTAGSSTPLDKFSNFDLIDKLTKIRFNKKDENIVLFLYKDREGNIGFFSKNYYESYFKYKTICSTGKPLNSEKCKEIISIEGKPSEKLYVITYKDSSNKIHKYVYIPPSGSNIPNIFTCDYITSDNGYLWDGPSNTGTYNS